jgi:alpha 1,6-mannosyltransferase
MISYKTIHQTDTSKETSWETQDWINLNEKDGWKLNFMDDEDARVWMLTHFQGSDIEWAWEYMHRGVLRADLLRYLLPLVEGGVYADVDVGRPPE